MWTAQMKAELKTIFDSVVAKPEFCNREELRQIAKRAGEDPEELDDQIDLLEFDESTDLLDWEYFFEWWSEEVDPRDWLEPNGDI